MSMSLKKILVTGASLLMMASVGTGINNINVNARHVRSYHTFRRGHRILRKRYQHHKRFHKRKTNKLNAYRKNYKHKKFNNKKKFHKSPYSNIYDSRKFPKMVREIKSQTFSDINKERIAHGVQALSHNPKNTYLANLRARELARNKTISHYNADGKLAAVADAQNAGFSDPDFWGENTAVQYITEISPTGGYETNTNGRQMANSANDAMMYHDQDHGNGHRINILRPPYKYVGIGSAYNKSDDSFYITEDFTS